MTLPASNERGFTLLELLVVIAIIAIVSGGIGFALRDGAQTTLEREAERLAALLESARAQSRSSGTAVRWRPTGEGFAFDGIAAGALPDHWLATGVRAQPATREGRSVDALQLGPDPIIAPQQVLLTLEGQNAGALLIATDGLRPFAVTGAATPP